MNGWARAWYIIAADTSRCPFKRYLWRHMKTKLHLQAGTMKFLTAAKGRILRADSLGHSRVVNVFKWRINGMNGVNRYRFVLCRGRGVSMAWQRALLVLSTVYSNVTWRGSFQNESLGKTWPLVHITHVLGRLDCAAFISCEYSVMKASSRTCRSVYFKLFGRSVGVNASVNCCLSRCSGPVIDWRAARPEPRLSPAACREKFKARGPAENQEARGRFIFI